MNRTTLVVSISVILSAQGFAQDWPQWRGPNRDGVAAGFKAPSVLPDKLTPRWKVDVGIGYSTPVLAGNRLYTFTRRNDNEVLTALDADTGKIFWQVDYPAPVVPQTAHGAGPKSTPAFSNGRLFTHGISGILSAFDAASGKLLWRKPAPAVQPEYNTASSPLVDRGLVIVHVGGYNKGALTAFEEKTGDVKWSWNEDGPSYGSPIITEFEGIRQVVTLTQQNLIGVSADTGKLLWQRPYKTQALQNAITPIQYGQSLIVSGYEKPITAFLVSRNGSEWVTKELWENPKVSLYLSNAVVLQFMVFGMSHRSSGQYFALDPKTGEAFWLSEPRQGINAAIVRAGDLLFVLEDDGDLRVMRPNAAKAFETLRSYEVAADDSPTWAQPVISGNRIFIKDGSSVQLWTLN